jgi:hypothetical protein
VWALWTYKSLLLNEGGTLVTNITDTSFTLALKMNKGKDMLVETVDAPNC